MKQNDQPQKPIENGFGSITAMLSEISQNTISGNNILNNIQQTVGDIKSFIGESLVSLISKSNNENILRTSYKKNIFLKIYDQLSVLTDYLINQKIPNAGKIPNDKSAKSEKADKSINVTGLTKLINALSTKLNPELFKAMNDFNEAFAKMINFDDKKAERFNNSIQTLSVNFEAFYKTIKPLAVAVFVLAAAFMFLGLTAMNPLFLTGMGLIALFMHYISKAIGSAIEGMLKFAIGMVILAYALIVFKDVDFGPVFMLLRFVFLLRLALISLPFATSLPTKILAFAIGISFLIWALSDVSMISWMAIAKMISFIVLLGLALRALDKTGASGFTGGPKMGAMMSFGFGLGLMVLALYALEDVQVMSMVNLVSFVTALGLAIGLTSRVGGGFGPMKGLPGFAFGLGLLILEMFLIDDIPILAALKLLVFIAILTLELKLLDKVNGSEVGISGLPGFSFGIGLLVLAMYAMDELPWIAIGKMLLFIGGLGIVLRLFPKSGTISMVGIGFGLLILAGAFWIFKKTKFTPEDALNLALSVGLVVAIVALMGMPEVAPFIGIGALLLILVAVSALVAGVALGLLSLIEVDIANIGWFLLASTMLAVGFALIAVPAVPAVVGAALFLVVAVSSLVSAGMLGLISLIPMNLKNIGRFILAAGLLAVGMAALSAPAAFALIGSTLFLPVALFSLLSAGMLGLISIIPYKLANITKFILGVGIIVTGFSLLILPATIALVTATLFLPTAIIALLTTGMLGLISIIPMNLSNITNFVLGAGILVAGFALLVIPTVPALIGVTLFLPVALLSLANALILGGISKIPMNFATIKSFMMGAGLITLGFAGIAIPAVPALIGAGMFLPIANAALKGAQALSAISKMVVDNKRIEDFKIGFGKIIEVFNDLSLWKLAKAGSKAKATTPIITAIGEMIKTLQDFGKVDSKGSSLSDTMAIFLNSLADDKKWEAINKHLTTMKNNVKDIVTNINMLKLGKAFMFNETLRMLSVKDSNEKMGEVVANLKEMIGLLYENARIQAAQVQAQTPAATTEIVTVDKTGKQTPESIVLAKKEAEEKRQQETLDHFVEALELATLNVVLVEGSKNKFPRY